jgi:hypothetical protein
MNKAIHARELVTILRNGVTCDTLHHSSRDRHDSGDPCPVLARIDTEIADLFLEREGPSTCAQDGHLWEVYCSDCWVKK